MLRGLSSLACFVLEFYAVLTLFQNFDGGKGAAGVTLRTWLLYRSGVNYTWRIRKVLDEKTMFSYSDPFDIYLRDNIWGAKPAVLHSTQAFNQL